MAAYFDGLGGVYYDYPTGTDMAPGNCILDPDPGNHANYPVGNCSEVGGSYSLTEVGEFESSTSSCGTFDQGGNLWEWNETRVPYPEESRRGVRGGSWGHDDMMSDHGALRASFRLSERPHMPNLNDGDVGFRVALMTAPNGIPTVSEWGILIMMLLLLGIGRAVVSKRGRLALDCEAGNKIATMRARR